MSKINLILAGGGVRVGAYIGALYALKERGITIEKIVGISGGSIVSSLYAAGHSLERLKDLMLELDYTQFKDFNPLAILTGMGLYKGRRFERWIDKELGGRRFSDAFELDHYVVATDILKSRPIVFSKESFPDLKVSKAVRFSIGIPLFYTYKKFRIGKDEKGIMVNGNLAAFQLEDMFHYDEHITLTLRLATDRADFIRLPRRFSKFNYPQRLVNILMNSLERERIAGDRWRNTIIIFSGNISATKFDLSREEKLYLFEQGYTQVKENLHKVNILSKIDD
jgi:NTE family protein